MHIAVENGSVTEQLIGIMVHAYWLDPFIEKLAIELREAQKLIGVSPDRYTTVITRINNLEMFPQERDAIFDLADIKAARAQ